MTFCHFSGALHRIKIYIDVDFAIQQDTVVNVKVLGLHGPETFFISHLQKVTLEIIQNSDYYLFAIESRSIPDHDWLSPEAAMP